MTERPFTAPVALTGARVVLAVPTDGDVDRIAELCHDAAIAAWTTVPAPYVRQDAEDFVHGMVATGWADGRSLTWAIRPARGGELLGMIALDGVHEGEGEVGFWLAPEARGLGLMSEALALVVDFAFAPVPQGLGLERLVWHAFAGNAASASVARRAGFRFEGVRRLGAVQRGRRLDDWQAALLEDDPRTPAEDWPPFTRIPLGERRI